MGVVVIGRNEGERLRRCLQSLLHVPTRVYVDSGSSDGSQAAARALGFELVELDTKINFTAARARNAGFETLLRHNQSLEYVQFVDGDCEVEPDWIEEGLADFRDSTACVFGRRQERRPRRNIFHKACDIEWQVPAGQVNSCGGDALFRVSALQAVGGYNPAMIAGEEPEMCLRLRGKGWQILSNAKPMTWHDVDISRWSQWWRRCERTGFGFSALVELHGDDGDQAWRRLINSAVAWSGVIASLILLLIISAATANPLSLLLLVGLASLLGAAMVRTAVRFRLRFESLRQALAWSGLLYVSKLAQAQGYLRQRLGRLRHKPAQIIEYK